MPHLTLSPLPGRLDVQTDWSDKELVKEVPGTYWDAGRRTWHCPMTYAACLQMRGVFGERLTYSEEVAYWAASVRERLDYARYLARAVEPPDGMGVPGLFPWQVTGYQWAWTVMGHASEAQPQGALLGDDQGTGKTVTACVALANLPDAFPALVICPNSVKRVWYDEAPKWIEGVNVYLIEGSAAARQRQMALALDDDRGLMVINYEAVRSHSRLAPYGSTRLKRCTACGGPEPKFALEQMLDAEGQPIVVDGEVQYKETITNAAEVVRPAQCHVHPKELNGTRRLRTVILDEAQALKDPKSQQTRACWAVCHDPSVTRRLATTGTPISNEISEAWGIFHAVQPDEYPVRSGFIARYAQQQWNDYGGMNVVGIRADTAAELFGFLDPRYRRVTKAQAAPWLPEKYRSHRFAELPTKLRKAYEEMEGKLITRLDDGTILFAPSELTQSGRLIQLASSYGTVETTEVWNQQEGRMEERQKFILKDNPSPKVDMLIEFLEERAPDSPGVAVYAVSRQLLVIASERLKALGVPHGCIFGGVSPHDREVARTEFQAGRLRCLLFNDAGGAGLTMTAADTIVRLQRSWSILKNLQCEDRVHRIGSEIHDKIHIVDFISGHTVEEWQLHKLMLKLQQMEELRRDGIDPMTWLEATGDDLRTAVYEPEAA